MTPAGYSVSTASGTPRSSALVNRTSGVLATTSAEAERSSPPPFREPTPAWPDEVRDYLTEHTATATVATGASAVTAGRIGVEPLRLLRLRYLDPTGLVDRLGLAPTT